MRLQGPQRLCFSRARRQVDEIPTSSTLLRYKSSFLTATSLPTDSVHHMEDGRVRSDRK